MRFSLALDERAERDRQFETHGVSFILDPFTATLVQQRVKIDYDPQYDSFSVSAGGVAASEC
ncbi:MAG: iron-sulfur cluster biosynthesis family protein [Bacilli bacterium]